MRMGWRWVVAAAAIWVGAGSRAGADPILTTNLFGGPGPASTVDAGFTALGGTAKESFGLEGNVNLTNQQIRFNALTGAAPGTFTFNVARNTQFVWVSGREYDFEWSYSGDATKQLSAKFTDTVTGGIFEIGPYAATFGDVKSLVFRQRVPVDGTNGLTSSSITIKDLDLNGTAFSNSISLMSDGTDNLANYFSITNFDFTQSWTLKGSVIQSWAGGTPQGNRINWQIKGFQEVVPAAVVPEPSSIALVGIGLATAGLVGWRRRRRAMA